MGLIERELVYGYSGYRIYKNERGTYDVYLNNGTMRMILENCIDLEVAKKSIMSNIKNDFTYQTLGMSNGQGSVRPPGKF